MPLKESGHYGAVGINHEDFGELGVGRYSAVVYNSR